VACQWRDRTPAGDVSVVAYRVALEALSNVRKHAHASRVVVELEEREGLPGGSRPRRRRGVRRVALGGPARAPRARVDQRAGRWVGFGGASSDVLFEELHERLYKALYFITGSSADAEELAQDAFLKLWERWDSIGSIEDPTAWLFRVALNGFRLRVRRARVAARKLPPGPPPPDPYEEVELREDVRRLLLGLPTRQRAAIVLTEIFGYGSQDAARILGIKPTTVRGADTTHHRARPSGRRRRWDSS
jgi:RNA polymerase sigma factor (sigma-70 family)